MVDCSGMCTSRGVSVCSVARAIYIYIYLITFINIYIYVYIDEPNFVDATFSTGENTVYIYIAIYR